MGYARFLNHIVVSSPIGNLLVKAAYNKITALQFTNQTISQITSPRPPLLVKAVTEIDNYFRNPQYKFTVKIAPLGTTLQQKIWRAGQKISPGQTKTYADIAREVKTSPRVVGNAMRKNPILLIIPCHRVVAKHGLGGFAGKTSGNKVAVKNFLLKLEQQSAYPSLPQA